MTSSDALGKSFNLSALVSTFLIILLDLTEVRISWLME